MTDDSPKNACWSEQKALSNADGFVDDLRDLLKIWQRQTPRLVTDIRHALADDDDAKLHLATHTLKGSLQILGAEPAKAATEALETMAKSGQLTRGTELLVQLEDDLAKLSLEIEAYLNQG